MKINLLIDNPAEIRNGYVNVDAATPKDCTDGRVSCELFNLSPVCDDGEAEEIVAHEIIDWFPGNEADLILSHWLKKLAHRGKLTVSTLDLFEVAKGIRDGLLPIDKANALIYGDQDRQWNFRKCGFSLSRLTEVLVNLGFNVTKKRIHDYRAIVTCERP